MYAFIYVDPEIMPVEDHFTATKTFVVNSKNISTTETALKYCPVFTFICSVDY